MENYEKYFNDYSKEMRSKTSGWPDIQSVLDEVDLKIEHSYMVRDRCVKIAKWLKLPGRDTELAAIAGLYHDLGRFRQAREFGTMSDSITGSHGDMSADIFLNEALKDGLSPEEIELIADSIRWHNRFKLPENLPPRTTLFAKLVRDGDKLEIFNFYTDKAEKRSFRFVMPTKDGDYSPEMLEGVLKGENLSVSGIRSKNDRKLMQISLLYDMNFGYSFRYMLEKDYLGLITGVTDGTADKVMKQVYDYAVEWMKERMDLR